MTAPLLSPRTAPAERKKERFNPIDQVELPTVSTAAAAYYLNRKVQTLYNWASAENGPVRPRRIHGRLAWPVSEIRALLGVEA